MSQHELPKKIGSLILQGFHGTKPEDPEVQGIGELIHDGILSGVVLFGYNIESPEQLSELTGAIKNLSAPENPIIAVDQEGGHVSRLNPKRGFPAYPTPHSLGEADDLEATKRSFLAMGQQLASVGINFSFAPCVDLHSINQLPPSDAIGRWDRSFGSDPVLVTAHSRAAIQGFREAGIISTIKHYPGHGNAQGDTHLDLLEITSSWDPKELLPYQELIRDGVADSVMTAHLIHSKVDPDLPATLSKPWIDKLRHEFNYDGVVISDDLHMGGILNHFSPKISSVQALRAGVDLLLFSNNPAAAKGVSDFTPNPTIAWNLVKDISGVIHRGELSEEDIDRSYRRVQALKRLINRPR